MSSPMMRTFGSRSISSIIASRIASRYDFSLMLTLAHGPRAVLGDDVREQRRGIGQRTLLGELDCVRGFVRRPLIHPFDVAVGQSADLAEAVAEDRDRV